MQKIVLASCMSFSESYPDGLSAVSHLFPAPRAQLLFHDAVDSRFPDGEICVDVPEFAPGAQIFVFQSLCGDDLSTPDTALFSALAVIRAYKEYGAGPVVMVAPHLVYCRQDRVIAAQRRPVTIRLIADLLKRSGADGVVAVRSGSARNICESFHESRLIQTDFDDFTVACANAHDQRTTVIIAPDAGALGVATRVAARTGHRVVSLEKHREDPETVVSTIGQSDSLAGAVHGLIVDDLICSAGTIAVAIEAVRKQGLRSFSIVAPHSRLTATGKSRLISLVEAGLLQKLYTTDAVPLKWRPEFVEVTPFTQAFRVGLARAFKRMVQFQHTEIT
jgi:ribose-phosphate pyrophosphokinase